MLWDYSADEAAKVKKPDLELAGTFECWVGLAEIGIVLSVEVWFMGKKR